MRLYHASRLDYAPGRQIIATSQSSFYPLAVPALNAAKPAAMPSRDVCLCATDDIGFALLFALTQKWPYEHIRLYEVGMSVFHRGPMVLVHTVQRRLENSLDVSTLTSEYWSPQRRWKYFECIGPEMEIIGAVELPTINEVIMRANYDSDIREANAM
jgi:hypothetical protein